MRERLKRPEIAVLKMLYRAGALHGGAAVSLPNKLRSFVAPLWRRWLVEVWHQQIPDEGTRGPLYALSRSGARLIQSIMNAREELPRKTLL
jgi:hypothetical protein